MPTLDLGPVVGPPGPAGTGDMQKTVYDPQGHEKDIFKYVDDKMKDIPAAKDVIKVTAGGTLVVPASLGPGPYTIEFTAVQEE